MLKDLPVLTGNAGLGEATASPSHCWAFLDLYISLAKPESWERVSRAQGSTCEAKANEGEMGNQREWSEDALLAGGVNLGGVLSSQQQTIEKREQLIRKTRPFVLFCISV